MYYFLPFVVKKYFQNWTSIPTLQHSKPKTAMHVTEIMTYENLYFTRSDSIKKGIEHMIGYRMLFHFLSVVTRKLHEVFLQLSNSSDTSIWAMFTFGARNFRPDIIMEVRKRGYCRTITIILLMNTTNVCKNKSSKHKAVVGVYAA